MSCRKQRQTLADTGKSSSPASAVAPVAVSALMASK